VKQLDKDFKIKRHLTNANSITQLFKVYNNDFGITINSFNKMDNTI
jgi:hypothetical protein